LPKKKVDEKEMKAAEEIPQKKELEELQKKLQELKEENEKLKEAQRLKDLSVERLESEIILDLQELAKVGQLAQRRGDHDRVMEVKELKKKLEETLEKAKYELALSKMEAIKQKYGLE
jgi:hypothetical protein